MIIEKLKQLPETDLLELLEIYSDELVDRFPDKIEEKLEFLERELVVSNSDDDEESRDN